MPPVLEPCDEVMNKVRDDLCRDGLTIVACRMHGWDDEKCCGGVVS